MRPYSLDIRTKVREAYRRGEGSQRALAVRFDVSLSFVRDLIRLARETGSIEPRHQSTNAQRNSKLDSELLEFVSRALAEHPGLSLSQLCNKLEMERKICVSRATLWRAINRQRRDPVPSLHHKS
jgi:transposase